MLTYLGGVTYPLQRPSAENQAGISWVQLALDFEFTTGIDLPVVSHKTKFKTHWLQRSESPMQLLLQHSLAQRAHVFANVVRRIQDLTGQRILKGRHTPRASLQPLGLRNIIQGLEEWQLLQAGAKSETVSSVTAPKGTKRETSNGPH